jgi:formate/nitrite transporter
MVARRRILVVDDEQTVRESCERIFNESGYDVETAASGEDGVALAMRGYFDCALIDLRMPDMDGMEIVRTARENRGNMAVLIITGYGAVDTAAEAARLGVADYVCKPFTPEEIVQAVGGALARPPTAGAGVLDRVLQEVRQGAPKPEDYEHRSPRAVAAIVTKSAGVKKATTSALNVLVLGILAGVYIGFGAALATLVASDAPGRFGTGVGQVLIGSVFSVGLILVVVAGAELFTGNSLMITGVLGKEYGLTRMLTRWAVVYAANFVGAMLLAFIMYQSGLWRMGSNAVGLKAVAIAHAKVDLSFGEAFFRGVGCNWLVCLAVWMAFSAKEIAGKVLVIFFPIMAFVALGYEHCVANMYFIPMGLMLKGTAAAEGLAGARLESLTWGRFLTANLVPVTLGNIVGGAMFVGSLYWWVYMRSEARNAQAQRR